MYDCKRARPTMTRWHRARQLTMAAAFGTVGIGWLPAAEAQEFDDWWNRIYFMGRVGIGTRNPVDKLDVVGNIRIAANRILNLVTGDGGSTVGIGLDRNDVLAADRGSAYPSGFRLSVSSGSGLFIDDSGRAGIGVERPAQALDVNGNINLSGQVYQNGVPFTGKAGPAGPAGPMGATGPAGPAGPAGLQGTDGRIGPPGANGAPGESVTGASEPAGENCATGGIRLSVQDQVHYVCNGAAGPDGAMGPIGAAGPAGPMGPAGPAGPAGDSVIGSSELPGSNCAAGGVKLVSGENVIYVCNGLSGAPGAPGATGPQGLAGEPGAPGESVTASSEPAGGNCTTGGVKLVSGAETSYVCNGAQGATGPAGAMGPQGAVGPAGPAGPAGAPGERGADGAPGAPGGRGPAGPTGERGPAGPAGVPGASPFSLSGSSAVYTAGAVGIGTVSPQATLDVNGNARFGGNAAAIGTNAGTGCNATTSSIMLAGSHIWDACDGNLYLHPGGGGAYRVGIPSSSFTVAGNVGIGTTSPAAKLDVQGSVAVSGSLGVGTNAPAAALEVNGGVRLNARGGKPTCSAALRGTLWVTPGGTGVQDEVEVCAKSAADTYAWRTLL